ncbi:MAG: replication initiator protein [Arizlama microvirus]|nr:MAG: replication initiator protein [Arizlama microvirus]
MPCYHPLTAYRSSKGRDPVKGTWPIVFGLKGANKNEKLSIPCGQCIGCRLERSRQWAIRCVHESELYDENCFLTLTYNDDNIERCKNGSLNKRDFVLFMKRLRKDVYNEFGKRVRFFHCGEYGEQTGRPHHHVCLFGFTPQDRDLWSVRNGVSLYRSNWLSKRWTFGYCTIGDCTFESAAYVARYVLKKVTGEAAKSHYSGKEPEYVTMSRRPGIGREWYEENKSDILKADAIVMRGGMKLRPPRYYDKLYDVENHSDMLRRKEERVAKVNVLNTTRERLSVKEKLKKQKLKQLKRSYENGNENLLPSRH